MKKYYLYIILSVFIGFFQSCADFLDTAPEGMRTIEDVFKTRDGNLSYLANVYSNIRTETGWSNESPWTPISDELDVTWAEYRISSINAGLMNTGSNWYHYWKQYYQAIRSANYYLQHLNDTPDSEINPEFKNQLRAEAYCLRAWFYFCLFRQFGPFTIADENPVDPEAPIEVMYVPRSTVSECIKYIDGSLQKALALNSLPDKRPVSAVDYGRITKATCLALRSRLYLYAASDFYNRDKNPHGNFKNFKNNDGTLLFDYTSSDSHTLWTTAAQAAQDVINMNFSLHKDITSGVLDPCVSYQNVFVLEWNEEVIYARPEGPSIWEMNVACRPRFSGWVGWAGWNPTQNMVDAYFMADGTSPFKHENGYTICDASGKPMPNPDCTTYSETGYSTSAGDKYGEKSYTEAQTFNMYVKREPRFYISICFENSRWVSKTKQDKVHFYFGGTAGPDGKTRDYSQTGYLCRKLVDPNDGPSTSAGTRSEIVFRLGEIYLNYAEALNEVDYEANKTEILKYINLIRERAGIPLYGTGANTVLVPADQAAMRSAIRAERRVELAFESHRYFDCKRWIISEKTDNGPFYGVNIMDKTQAEAETYESLKRKVFETRVFELKNYLWPLSVSELTKDPNLVQNPYWSNK